MDASETKGTAIGGPFFVGRSTAATEICTQHAGRSRSNVYVLQHSDGTNQRT